MLGYTAAELRGMGLHEIVAHDRETVEANVERTLREGTRFIRERKYLRKDGSVVEVEIAASAIDYGGKRVICAAIRDITERKKTEEALRRSFDSLLALYEAGQILGSSLERDEIGLRLLEFTERVSGLEAAILSLGDEQGRMSEWRSVGPEEVLAAVRERPEVRSAVDEVSKGGRARAIELRRPPNPKSQTALTGVFVPLRARGRVIGVLGAYGPPALAHKETREAISSLAVQGAGALENARLYEELAERERELHDLVGRMMAAQEEERHRVAYEVHDGFTQTAAAAYRRLALFASTARRSPRKTARSSRRPSPSSGGRSAKPGASSPT
jgi:PAS domain-containing protein